MRRDCSFGSKLLVVGGWSLVVGLIVAWVLSWCGSLRGTGPYVERFSWAAVRAMVLRSSWAAVRASFQEL
jgi:hypothetical protein